ncbi:Ig-like domain-containing protein [Rhodococcus sp. AG1013]|uniref:Ig-like domain-containing protein n=1 Tax=Rhodococcus sp. AG1013 TaxID=2183996 RepID=UPI000E0BC155|nr:Ig-like domain-containing protein [Rhodococcus sp. AG1013]RDI16237.1 Ig-like domain-containing protein [Rhodococcus sp. AG1013]
MSSSFRRRCAVAFAGSVVLSGPLLIVQPASAATSTVEFTTTCRATATMNVTKTPAASVTVTSPASVAPGETFTFRMQTNAQSFPDSDSGASTTNLSRLKNDFEIPTNATFVSASIVGNSAVNISGVAPSVIRVNDSGTVDPNGTILRISGNNEVIGNGASNSTNSEGGILAPKLKKNINGTPNGNGDSWFQMPAIDVTMVAGQPGVIQPKIRTSGDAGSYNNDKNFSTQLAKASFLGVQWAPTRCSPRNGESSGLNAGAGPLATIRVTVPDAATTTALTVPSTAATGSAVQLTAAVSPADASGTVQFKDNGNAIGAAVPVANGSAALSYAFGSLGAHSITAEFSGASGFASSTSEARTVTVTPPVAATTTAVTVPPNATTGLAVDLVAAVTPSTASGTVQFTNNGNAIGAPVQVAGGIATLSHTFTTTGAHGISASFSGGTGFAPSMSGNRTVTVSEPMPDAVATTTVVTAPSTAEVGAEVTISATVSPAPLDGTVQFRDGATNLGSPVLVSDGVATLAHTFARGGSHPITAVYSGGVGSLGSSASPVNVAVTASNIGTVTLLNAPGEAKTGAPIELWATVFELPEGTEVSNGGTVQFRDGATNLGSPVPVVGGTAKLVHTFDTAGTHAVSAVYSGAGAYGTSTTDTQGINVTAAAVSDLATAVELGIPASGTAGSPVTLTARVIAPRTPHGTVQFFDGDKPLGVAVDLVDGRATLAHTFTGTGAHSITAKYSGAEGFIAATSTSGTLAVTEAGGTTGGGTTTGSIAIPAFGS